MKSSKKGAIRLDFEERSFYRFSLLATQINRSVAAAYVQKFGRPVHGWKIITLLGRFGPLTASQIAAHTTLEMDKVTRIVDTLVEQGVTSRQQDKEDRRRVIISLTAKGRRNNALIEQMIGAMEREFLIVLNPDEREQLYSILDRLRGRANQIFSAKQDWNIVS
jgi:DNA-binding MarR family transcriptional regulator